MAFQRFKGGKLPPRRRVGIPALSEFVDRAAAWSPVPAAGWEFAVPASALSMLGNDQWGDCGPAGLLGQLQAQSYNAGRPLIPTTQDALNLYAQFGFNINAGPSGYNPTDNGTVLTDILAYAQNTGVTIGNTVHKIVGSAAVNISSVAELRWAAYTFGGLYMGLNLPSVCENNTTNWNFGAGQAIAGGHCVDLLGEGAAGGKIRSWGMFIPGTWEFLANYLDEAYVIVTPDWLDAQGKSPAGLDLDGLLAAIRLL